MAQLKWLLLGLFANAAGHAFLYAVIPALGRQLGFADIQTGLLLSLGALALTVSAPVWGWIAERRGRRPVLLIGFVAAGAGLAGFALVLTGQVVGLVAFCLLLGVRLVQSLMAGGLLPAAQAYVADITSAAGRAGGMGRMAASFGLGAVAGSGLAWAIAETGMAAGFALIAGLLGLSAVAAWRGLPESRPEAMPQVPVPVAAIWPNLLVTLLGVMAYSMIQQVTGLRLIDQLGLTPQQAAGQAGAALTATALTMVATQGLVVGRLALPPRVMALVGAVAALTGMVVVAQASGFAVMVGGMALSGVGIGLLLPANLAALTLAAGPAAQGRVAGINAVGQGLGLVAGPLVGATLHQLGPAAPGLAAAGIMAVIGLLMHRGGC